jgi:outer membrane protein assembly factor BamB/hemolysin-activating ACP:hemolysin acyltransferase
VGTDGGALRAIDVATGAELWHFQVEAATRKGIWSSPALAEGKVLFGAYNGSLYCLDTMTGAEIWHANPADWIGSSPIVSSRYGLVLVGLEHALPGAEGSVAAFDLETGSKVWEHPVSEFIHASPTLSADEEQVFVGTNGGDFICLDTASGALRWRHRAEGAFKAAAAVSAIHKTVVVGSFDQCIYLLESSTGRTIATVKTGGSIYASPLILGDAAYIGSLDKNLYVIDLIDGTVIKRIALGARILATPVLLDGLIYVGTTGGRLLGIDPASLAVRETLQLPDRIVNPPLLLQGGSLLVVPVTGNRLLGFGVSRTDYSEPQQGAFVAGQVPAPKPVPLSAPIVDAARPEGLFYRIDEPSAQAIARPYRSIPSRRLLGAASLLAIHSPNYRDLPLAEVGRRLLPPLVANQARVFLYGIQPIGLVTWAFLNEQSEQELAANSKLPELADWSNGDRPWIIDVVAPFGSSRAMLDKVRREALRGQTVKLLERAPDGSLRTTTLHP